MDKIRLISIVIPTYQRDDTLFDLLTEIARQRREIEIPIEIIVVDNAVADSAREVVARFDGAVTYVAMADRGVARARNAGVAASRGDYVIFVDDDQSPGPGWLAAFADASKTGQAAYFGKVSPSFSSPPEDYLREIATTMFSRQFDVPSGADITAMRAYLGTGNAMFNRGLCLAETPPFDDRFDGGGEDVFLFSKLSQRPALRFRWCPEAAVHEIVPASRVHAKYLMLRRFKNGQIRSRVEAMSGRPHRMLFWMAAGLVQLCLLGAASAIALLVDRRRATAYWIGANGGLGKVLWNTH